MKHPPFNKAEAIKKSFQGKRKSNDIYTEYMNTAASLGDKTLAMHFAKETLEKLPKELSDLTKKLASLKLEHDAAVANEKQPEVKAQDQVLTQEEEPQPEAQDHVMSEVAEMAAQ